MSLMKSPKIDRVEAPAAPAPAPQAAEPKRLDVAESSSRSQSKSQRKGRAGLRIDLQGGNAGAGGTGINVPQS